MSFLAQYVAGHPGFRELEVAEYTAGQLRLVVENLRYASYSLVWLQDRQVWQWIGSDYSDVTLEGEVRRTREILADEDAYHWVMELNGARWATSTCMKSRT